MGDSFTKQEQKDRKICLQFYDESERRATKGDKRRREENRVERCEGNERREHRSEG